MIELKEKRILLSAFILIVVITTLVFALSILPYFPSKTDIKNRKDSIYILDLEMKLNTTGGYSVILRLPMEGSPDLTPLYISGSIYDTNNLSLNHLFNYTDIIDLWVIVNSIFYKASEINPGFNLDKLFSVEIYHKNLSHDIKEVTILGEQGNPNTAKLEIIIQFGEIGQGQLLKSEINILTNLRPK